MENLAVFTALNHLSSFGKNFVKLNLNLLAQGQTTVRQKECNQLSYTPRQKKILMIPASNLKGEQEHLKTQFAHHHRQVDYNNNHLILPVHILLSLMAFLGNFLILVALHKVSSLHPPSKLLQRCLAITDLLVSIVSQPFIAPYWMSLVHKEWYLC